MTGGALPPPNLLKSSISIVLQKSRSLKSLKQIHAALLTSGLTQHRLLVADIAKSFALAGHLPHAYDVLRNVPPQHQCSFLLNSFITGVANGSGRGVTLVFPVYKHLVGSGLFFFSPDRYTFPVLLKSCAKILGVGEARQLHGVVLKLGYLSDDVFVQNALVHVYGVCCQVVDARKMFDEIPFRDVVSWTGLMSGFVKGGLFEQALDLFAAMDVEPNMATLVSVLVACGRLSNVGMGRRVHGFVLKREENMGLVFCNALLDMYVKCGCLDEAKQVFKELSCRDVFSWTSIISGLAHCRRFEEALEGFHEMQACKVEPDKVTLASVLSACASLGTLDLGRWVHDYVDRTGIEWDAHLGTAMVDMYAKCGCIETALHVFEEMPFKNILSWNALLGGLAMHGHGRDALAYYDQMVRSGFVPNEVTFIAVLSACSHSGLVEEGRQCFNSMTKIYNLEPRIEHYGCMVDLLGRAGLLEEARDLIKGMPMEADVLVWGAMLSACKAHGNVELFNHIQNYLLEMESSDSGVYVLLSNIYATNRRWRDVTRTRRLMKDMGIKKAPGSSVIELDGKAHEFLVGDSWNHPQKEEILVVLNRLSNQLHLLGQ